MDLKSFLDREYMQKAIAKANSLQSKKFSDVVDAVGHHYVNLVQEGGGVLGIALVGFTFILEQAGIRFWRLAGTSAGAINTMLLAALGEKNEPKSEKILEELAKVELISFADGHPLVPTILQKWLVNPNILKNIFITYLGFWILMLINLVLLAIHPNKDYALFTLISMSILIFLGILIYWLVQRFKKNNWGLCKGDVFFEWMKSILDKNGVSSITDLKRIAYKNHDECKLSISNKNNFDAADVTVITCDITNAEKIEFPKKASEYSLDEATTHPACFVRASMSIPLFFNPYQFQKNGPFFVDGGLISNFPISLFHKPEIRTPRIPIVGVILDEGYGSESDFKKGITTFLMRIFKTVMNYSDKEFLVKNEFYKKYCIHSIDVHDFNWLNFNLSDDEKIKLFERGVNAGLEYIEKFDWDEYKTSREALYDTYTQAFNLN